MSKLPIIIPLVGVAAAVGAYVLYSTEAQAAPGTSAATPGYPIPETGDAEWDGWMWKDWVARRDGGKDAYLQALGSLEKIAIDRCNQAGSTCVLQPVIMATADPELATRYLAVTTGAKGAETTYLDLANTLFARGYYAESVTILSLAPVAKE